MNATTGSYGHQAARTLGRALGVFTRVFVASAIVSSTAIAALEARAGTVEKRRSSLVTLREVTNGVGAKATKLGDVTVILRKDVETELDAIDWRKAGASRRYHVSAALVRLDSVRAAGALTVTCAVSATLRDAREGRVVAVVEGRARADDATESVAATQRDALAVAARSAVIALPEAIRRVE
jgi:hypothetical protein